MQEAVSFAGQVVALGAAVTVPLWALLELRARRIFLSRERYEKDRVEDAERAKEDRMVEAAQLAEVVVKPLTRIADRMDALAITQARHEEANRGIRRSVDDLRDDIKGMRESA